MIKRIFSIIAIIILVGPAYSQPARDFARTKYGRNSNAGQSTPIFYKDQFNLVVDDFFNKPYRKIEGFRRFE